MFEGVEVVADYVEVLGVLIFRFELCSRSGTTTVSVFVDVRYFA